MTDLTAWFEFGVVFITLFLMLLFGFSSSVIDILNQELARDRWGLVLFGARLLFFSLAISTTMLLADAYFEGVARLDESQRPTTLGEFFSGMRGDDK